MRIEPLGIGDVGSAVELVTRALRVDAGDRGEQFACDIAGESRQMFVAKVGDQVIAYGRVVKLAADEAARGLRLATLSDARALRHFPGRARGPDALFRPLP